MENVFGLRLVTPTTKPWCNSVVAGKHAANLASITETTEQITNNEMIPGLSQDFLPEADVLLHVKLSWLNFASDNVYYFCI